MGIDRSLGTRKQTYHLDELKRALLLIPSRRLRSSDYLDRKRRAGRDGFVQYLRKAPIDHAEDSDEHMRLILTTRDRDSQRTPGTCEANQSNTHPYLDRTK